MTGLWRNWTTAWCWAVGLFGAVLTGGVSELTDGPVRVLFDAMGDWGAPEMTPHLRFATALMGAVTLGWALTLTAAVRAADRLGAPMWRAITTGLVVWFAVDSALSVATGFALNAVSNTVFLIAYLIPVFASGVLGANTTSGSSITSPRT